MHTPKLPPLADLAYACNNGACNVTGLLGALAKAVFPNGRDFGEINPDLAFGRARENVELKIILGQMSYLVGEGLGPSFEALKAWETRERELTTPAQPLAQAA